MATVKYKLKAEYVLGGVKKVFSGILKSEIVFDKMTDAKVDALPEAVRNKYYETEKPKVEK